VKKNFALTTGSDNIFADLGLPDAEKLLIKANLVAEIQKAIRKNGLNQTEVARRMGLSESQISEMTRGHFSNLSERKLKDYWVRLAAG
jgi:predicted XRE-type DNA-binding protein